jgi:hypothetical protein
MTYWLIVALLQQTSHIVVENYWDGYFIDELEFILRFLYNFNGFKTDWDIDSKGLWQ